MARMWANLTVDIRGAIARTHMVVDDRVIVECKATERLAASAGPQLISYLRATIFQVAVLLHFGPHPKFYRFVDSVKDKARDKK